MNPVTPPLQVLYVNPFPELGGAEHSLLTLLSTLPSGVSPHLVTSREGALAERARDLGVAVGTLEFPGLRCWREARASAGALARTVEERGIHLVHGNSPRGAFYGGLAARRRRIPSIWHLRVHIGGGWRARLIRRFTDYRVAASTSLLDDAGLSVNDGKTWVVPNAVPPGFLRADATVMPTDRDPVIGMLGRLEPLKGQREFVELALAFHREGRPGTFLIGGEILGPAAGRPERRAQRYVNELRARLAAAGAADRVRFVGAVTDVAAFVDQLDVLVVPSHQEGFGRVVIEGMARGKPVVASDVGGIPEIIRTGNDGWLVPRRDPKALFRAVRFLLRNPAMAHEMGERARRRVASEYLARHTTAGILRVYAEIAGLSETDLGELSPPSFDQGDHAPCVSLST